MNNWDDHDLDNLDSINRNIKELNENYQGIELRDTISGMSGESAAGWGIILVLAAPIWLIWKIIKYFQNREALRKENEEQLRVAKEIHDYHNETVKWSRECAMQILEDIKREEYENEDPFWAPVHDNYNRLSTDGMQKIVDLLSDNDADTETTRGFIRYLMALPRDRARKELIEIKANLACRMYNKKFGGSSFESFVDEKMLERTRKKFEKEEKEREMDEESEKYQK